MPRRVPVRISLILCQLTEDQWYSYRYFSRWKLYRYKFPNGYYVYFSSSLTNPTQVECEVDYPKQNRVNMKRSFVWWHVQFTESLFVTSLLLLLFFHRGVLNLQICRYLVPLNSSYYLLVIVPRPSVGGRSGGLWNRLRPSVRASVRPSVPLFVNTISPKLLDGFSPNQVHWIRLTM